MFREAESEILNYLNRRYHRLCRTQEQKEIITHSNINVFQQTNYLDFLHRSIFRSVTDIMIRLVLYNVYR